MEVIILRTARDVGLAAAGIIARLIAAKADAVLGLATGASVKPSSSAASTRPWPAIRVPSSRTSRGMVQPNSRNEARSCSICSGGCSLAFP